MADCSTISGSSPFVGTGSLMGYVNAIIVHLDEKPIDISDATAQLQATYQDKLYATTNRAYYLPFSDVPERRVSEPISKEMSEGDIILGQKPGTQAVTIVADSCTVRTLHSNFKSSKVAWMYQFTNKDYVIGKDGVADETIAPVKVRISSTVNEGGPADPWEITLTVTLQEDYYDRLRNLKLDWEATDLISTVAITLQIVSSSTSEVVVRALTCNVCDASDLTLANFKVKTSAGVDEPVTAPSQNGNEYTLPATMPAGDHLAYYELPETSIEKWISNEAAFTTS